MVKKVDRLAPITHRKRDPIQLVWMVNEVARLVPASRHSEATFFTHEQARGGRVLAFYLFSSSTLFTIRQAGWGRELCVTTRRSTATAHVLPLRGIENAGARRKNGNAPKRGLTWHVPAGTIGRSPVIASRPQPASACSMKRATWTSRDSDRLDKHGHKSSSASDSATGRK